MFYYYEQKGKVKGNFILKEKIMIALFSLRIYYMSTLNYQSLHLFHH